MERNMLGYGQQPPRIHWPGDARIAVSFVVNIEEGSEHSPLDGDRWAEFVSEVQHRMPQAGLRDLAKESLYEYGSRAGFWRLMRLFDERNLPVTCFTCAVAVERNAAIAAYLRSSAHEVCSHGYRWCEPPYQDAAKERDDIHQAVVSLERTTGRRPCGWFYRYAPTVRSRELLVQEGGFLYDSDAYDDDLPYFVSVGDVRHLVIPYALDTNDVKFWANPGFVTADQFCAYLKDSFDYLYQEGATNPKMMSVGLHPRIAGRPARCAGLARFVEYVSEFQGVWVARREDIAKHWRQHYS